MRIPQRLTAFACAVDGDRILMVRHERLGVVRWELPGGHVDPGETVAAAAARETLEETGVEVTVGRTLAEGRHSWRDRSVSIVYLLARPTSDGPVTALGSSDSRIHDVAWKRPAAIEVGDTSPLARPVIDLVVAGGLRHRRPLLFEATHVRTADGWEPTVTRSWQRVADCR